MNTAGSSDKLEEAQRAEVNKGISIVGVRWGRSQMPWRQCSGSTRPAPGWWAAPTAVSSGSWRRSPWPTTGENKKKETQSPSNHQESDTSTDPCTSETAPHTSHVVPSLFTDGFLSIDCRSIIFCNLHSLSLRVKINGKLCGKYTWYYLEPICSRCLLSLLQHLIILLKECDSRKEVILIRWVISLSTGKIRQIGRPSNKRQTILILNN